MAKRKQASPDADTAPAAAPAASSAPQPPTGYTVLARRYRPRQFAEVIGQAPVAQALTNALQSGRVAHAYLFTGARGVGKTSTARILAKALNCVKGPTPTPCDACDICLGIASGEDVDVVEIDGASNRQIDDVREIRQNVQFKPSRGRYKIYIIDEVHMLTKEAFNALLKTLEEPPPHVKFIFATTDAHKVPVTILSRCQRFDFAGIGANEIVNTLAHVVKSEGMEADPEALELISRRAGGSMRDAQSLLDQLLAFGGEKLTTDQVHRLLGTAPDDRVMDLAAALLARDAKLTLELLDQAAGEGLQLGELLDQLLNYWRDLMVVHCAGADARGLTAPPRHRATLTRQAKDLSLDTILAGLEILAGAKNRLRGSSHTRTWIEMALVRLARLEDLASLTQLTRMLANPAERLPEANVARPTPAAAAPTSLKAAVAGRTLSEAPVPSAPATIWLTNENVEQVWKQVLTQIGSTLASSLEKAGIPAISGPNSLAIRFSASYTPFCKRFQDSDGSQRVGAVLQTLTGQKWTVRVESAEPQAAKQSGTTDPNPAATQSRQEKEDGAAKAPLVQRAKDVLKAGFSTIEEGFGAKVASEAGRTDDSETEDA